MRYFSRSIQTRCHGFGAVLSSIAAALLAVFIAGCESPAPQSNAPQARAAQGDSAKIDQPSQSKITPDQAIARLSEGDHRFVTDATLHRDYPAQVKATAAGQYPIGMIIACVDSRSGPEIIFDQGIGDLFVARVAGNYCPVDLLGSAEFATKVAGAKLVVVLGHSECGAIKGACDNVELGNLTTVIYALRPATTDVHEADVAGDRTSKNAKFVQAVAEANVRRTVAGMRAASPVLRDLEQSGQIKIVGAMYAIDTGEVTWLK